MTEIPLHEEIEQRFGVLPNFFRLASDTPEITANLWGFAQFAYLDSSLPSLFKERLFVYLSRFCEVRYCIARHIGFLVGLGYPAGDRDCLPQTVEQVLPLLQRPLPRGEALEPAIALCAAVNPNGFEFPSPDTSAESAIFACATHVFLQTPDAPKALVALRQLFGTARLELINVFLAFVQMAHYWTQLHPELHFEDDVNHLLATHEVLADYLLNDPEVKDNALNQQVLEELAALRQLQGQHENLLQAYKVVSRENEQLPIERQERQRIEANLHQSETRLQLALDASEMGTFLWHIQDDHGELDARMLELFGLPADSTLTPAEILATLIHPDDRIGYAEAVNRAINPDGDGLLRQEVRVIHPDGSMRWLAISGQTFFETNSRRAVRMSGMAADITDRKQAELALQRSETRLRAVAANLPNGAIFILDHELRYQLAAGKALEEAGFTPEDLVGKTIWEALDPELATRYEPHFRQALNGEPFRHEHHSHDRDYASHGIPLFDAQGEVDSVLAVSYDITDRKRAEEQQAYLLKLSDALRPFNDPASIKATANRMLGEQLAVDRVLYAEYVRKDDEDYFLIENVYHVPQYTFPDGLAPVGAFGRDAYEVLKGKTIVINDVFDDAGISPEAKETFKAINVAAYVALPLMKEGKFVALIALNQVTPREWKPEELALLQETADRTWAAVERARAEAALCVSEEKYRTLFESIDQGFCVIEVLFDQAGRPFDYRFLEVNPAFEQQSGLVQAVGKRILELAPTHEQHWFEAYGRIAMTGEPLRFENHAKALNRWFDVYAYRVGQPEARKVAVVFKDISDRKTAEQEREQLLAREQAAREVAENANRIKDEFLAVLSHELRSPLNPILGWSSLLRKGRLNAEKTAYALETIERNAQLQVQLIEDLLDVSRILRGKLTLNRGPVNLTTTIRAALETVRLAAEAKSIPIQTELDAEVGPVLGDSARLQQIIWNLLTNAVKFTPEGGQVKVGLQRIGTQAQIQVRDTGKGIDPDFLPHVFEYFQQADSTTTRKFGGLGLGLAIVHHLVELHGGTVQANSLGDAQGATFTVSLPLLRKTDRQTRDELEDSPELTSHSSPLTGLRILLVDDDSDALDLITFMLEESGAIVTAVPSAAEALQSFRQTRFDVLTSDIGMPGMDGYMLIRQIRTMPPEQGGEILAIALTAYAGELDQQQAISAGFQKHIAKPIKPEVLVQTIESLVGKRSVAN